MEACKEAASWDEPLRIAVNVSAAQSRRENLDAQVRSALRESGLPSSSLELEITEGVLIEPHPKQIAFRYHFRLVFSWKRDRFVRRGNTLCVQVRKIDAQVSLTPLVIKPTRLAAKI